MADEEKKPVLGLMGQVWCLDNYMLAMHKQDAYTLLARQEEQARRVLLADIGKVLADGRGYYVRYGQAEHMEKIMPVEQWKLVAQVMLTNPREANVGDVVYGPAFEQMFHPGQATIWYLPQPPSRAAICEPLEPTVTLPRHWQFVRLVSGHWQRVS